MTDDEDYKEYWTIAPDGNLPWFIRAAKNPRGFMQNSGQVELEEQQTPPSATESRTSRHDDKEMTTSVRSLQE